MLMCRMENGEEEEVFVVVEEVSSWNEGNMKIGIIGLGLERVMMMIVECNWFDGIVGGDFDEECWI